MAPLVLQGVVLNVVPEQVELLRGAPDRNRTDPCRESTTRLWLVARTTSCSQGLIVS